MELHIKKVLAEAIGFAALAKFGFDKAWDTLAYRFPALTAFDEGRELDVWIWTYRVWCGWSWTRGAFS